MSIDLLERRLKISLIILFLLGVVGGASVVRAEEFTYFCSSPQGEYQWDAMFYKHRNRFGHYFLLELSNKKVFRFRFVGPNLINFAWLAPDGGVYPFNIQFKKNVDGFDIHSTSYPDKAGFICRKRY